ncbi:transposase [Streptomyces sp. NPDC006617]|uniref:transposase n=1 Tax=Streptomyces sp. NPDC006617 TaxID=3155354 RepID=UPI0033A1F618
MNRPDRTARRLLGKSDPLDAQAAARAVLSGRARARAKSGDGPLHSARIYKLAKASAVKARLPDGGGDEDAATQATHMTPRMLAERIEQLTAQINELDQRLTRLVEHHAPQLLEPVGIGPDSAVTLLITMGDNPERLKTEASFAALCGVSPIEYSSGPRCTRRLNHGGDHQANAALHRIVFTRLRHDPRTRRTTNAAPRRARLDVRSSDASRDTQPARSSTWSDRSPAPRAIGASAELRADR